MINLGYSYCENFLLDKMRGTGSIINFDTYELIYANQNTLDELGITTKEFGRPCYEVLHNFSEPCFFCKREALLEKNPHKWHRYEPHNDKHLSVIDYLFEENGVRYLAHTAVDMSEELNLISDLKATAFRNDVIIDCATVLFQEQDIGTSIELLIKILCNFYNAECGFILERNYEEHSTKTTYKYCHKDSCFANEDFSFEFRLETISNWTEYIANNNHIFFLPTENSLSIFPIKEGPFALKNCQNVLSIPLRMDDMIVGTIMLFSLKQNFHNFDILKKISIFIVNMLALKYSKIELEKNFHALKTKSDLNQAILVCAQTLIHDNDITLAIERLLKKICEHLAADYAYIFIRDVASDTLNARYDYYHVSPVADDLSSTLSFSIINEWYEVLKKEDNVAYMSCLEKDLANVSHFTYEYNLLIKQNIQSFLATPLFSNDKHEGFLWVDNPKTNTDDRTLLTTVAAFVVNHMNKHALLQKLAYLSYTDKLTGVLNRNSYMLFIDKAKNKAQKNLGIVYADANGLKHINDSFGHQYGDIVIRWCGEFLKSYAPNSTYRIGGDEFVCIFENIAELDFNVILNTMQKTIEQLGFVHLSLGARWQADCNDIEELVSNTDKNMYEVKQKYYQEQVDDTPEEQLKREEEYKNSILKLKDDLCNFDE